MHLSHISHGPLVFTYLKVAIGVCVRVCVCVCVRVRACVHVRTHTQAHTYPGPSFDIHLQLLFSLAEVEEDILSPPVLPSLCGGLGTSSIH
jgi:hypothetical protein